MVSKFKAHPWHGIEQAPGFPEEIIAFIEIITTDTVKYEIDKNSGYLKIDRPQLFSNCIPALYGFLPQTYCGSKVANLAQSFTSEEVIKGDGDPLDICVLTEKSIPHGDIIVNAKPIGGFTLIDKNEADDKIIAVLKDDQVYGHIEDLSQLPTGVVNRLKHYFLTYKQMPGEAPRVNIVHEYGREQALHVIRQSTEDYIHLMAGVKS